MGTNLGGRNVLLADHWKGVLPEDGRLGFEAALDPDVRRALEILREAAVFMKDMKLLPTMTFELSEIPAQHVSWAMEEEAARTQVPPRPCDEDPCDCSDCQSEYEDDDDWYEDDAW